MARSVDELLSSLTLEEKASLCSGLDMWNTKAVERLGIPSWMMTDGPHGLRKARPNGTSFMDAVPATCFPSGAGLASTWNRDLIEEVGRALGRESKAENVGVLLGPGANIKRSPLCGRNFEYFSEDPYLAGQIAKHHILGVQSQGVGASVKHFAANNQEKLRMTIDAVVDERTLREIYLPAFETAVKEAQPWTVMCSYNRINGTYAAENRWLLTSVLKEEWGHQGLVVTDWGANNDRVAGLKAGQDFEMPGNRGITDRTIVEAVQTGRLSMEDLDKAVRRILLVTEKALAGRDPGATFDVEGHHALARRTATEAMVLLQNDGTLPLAQGQSVAFIGPFARQPRYQGGGSSHMNPTRLDDPVTEAGRLGLGVTFADGSSLAEARSVAQKAEVAVVFIGLTDDLESEGFDRNHLSLPREHTILLDEVLKVQKRVVVVLSNGSPVEMPWLPRVSAVLEGYLGGQAWGGAVVDVLFGRANPSGKLAETFPRRLEDTPSYLNFPGDKTRVEYREGVFVGYRHYDAAHVEPLFPFGHGLSYTTFDYGPLSLDRPSLTDDETLTVSLAVTNRGRVAGAEVVQLYVGDREASVLRPVRELKAFAKVFLAPGETKTVTLTLDRRSFAFWSIDGHRWLVEAGEFELAVGASSRDLRQRATVTVTRGTPDARLWDQNVPFVELKAHPAGRAFVEAHGNELLAMFGHFEPGTLGYQMVEAMVNEMPLRNLVRMGQHLTEADLQALLAVLNQP